MFRWFKGFFTTLMYIVAGVLGCVFAFFLSIQFLPSAVSETKQSQSQFKQIVESGKGLLKGLITKDKTKPSPDPKAANPGVANPQNPNSQVPDLALPPEAANPGVANPQNPNSQVPDLALPPEAANPGVANPQAPDLALPPEAANPQNPNSQAPDLALPPEAANPEAANPQNPNSQVPDLALPPEAANPGVANPQAPDLALPPEAANPQNPNSQVPDLALPPEAANPEAANPQNPNSQVPDLALPPEAANPEAANPQNPNSQAPDLALPPEAANPQNPNSQAPDLALPPEAESASSENPSNELQDTENELDPDSQATDALSQTLIELKSFMAPYIYEPSNRHDPFEDPTVQLFIDSGAPVALKTPPEEYSLEQIKLKGIIWDTKAPRALFKLPNQDEYYTLSRGAKIGKNGIIFEIREDEVVILETALKSKGSFENQTRIIKILRLDRLKL